MIHLAIFLVSAVVVLVFLAVFVLGIIRAPWWGKILLILFALGVAFVGLL